MPPSTALLPRLEHVFHPTDFSRGSELAFAHALRVALAAKAALTLFHVEPERDREPWHEFPGVRTMLARWKLIPPGSPPAAVPALGIDVEKIGAHGHDPVSACLAFLEAHPADLVVLSTHGRDGVPRWLHRPVAEPLARESRAATLFVPHGSSGFVSEEDGGVALGRLLIPVDHAPPAEGAVEFVAALCAALGVEPAVTLLHVGDPDDAPAVRLPDDRRGWSRLEVEGRDALEEIVRVADMLPADLIAMATTGHEGFLDALRGSTTERVLRRAGRPLLAVPARR
ncbi:MAG TPA: universal stress protein [Myxococcota bacterium]|nr:universal stress protein [Myxococcota bacterium]